VDGAAVTTVPAAGGTYTFSNVTAVHTISAGFVKTYTITASAGTGGTISPSGAVSVNYGANKTFTITPSTGYTVSTVMVDGAAVTTVPAAGGTYTFSNVTAAHTISAAFTLETFSITASAGTGGAISPSGAVSVNYGAKEVFTITPSTGYALSTVLVDGTAVTTVPAAGGTYTFSNIKAAHTISATFTLKNFTITASAGTGGTISPSGAVSVSYGSTESFTVTPSTGYNVSKVLVDGATVATIPAVGGTYTFSNVTAAHTISATFTLETFTVTASAGSGGTISPKGAVSVSYGNGQSFTITPSTGYTVSTILVDGEVDTTVPATGGTYTFSNVTAAHTISAAFILETFTVTASAGTGGTINPSGAVSVNYGSSKAFAITPSVGYNVSTVLVDGAAVTSIPAAGGTYTFSNVTAAHTISVSFTLKTFIITASAGTNGTISPSGAISVNYGSKETFTVTPSTGYKVSKVLIDGKAVTTVPAAGGTYTFNNVTAAHTISAAFK